MLVYLSGPMRGLPKGNADAFAAAEASWRERGHDVINPHNVDKGITLASTNDDRGCRLLTQRDLARIAQIDCSLVASADAVAVLHGWQSSVGARMEVSVALFVGLPIFAYDPSLGIWVPISPNILVG